LVELKMEVDMLQWAVSLQEQQDRLFMWKAEVAADCAQLASTSTEYVYLTGTDPMGVRSPTKIWLWGLIWLRPHENFTEVNVI